jgi:tRNA-guanine family transglycosylase
VKGLTPEQLEGAGAQLILGNTYHLESAPGSDLVAAMGGLHDFIGWRRAMLTDSGGFQARNPALLGSPARLHSICVRAKAVNLCKPVVDQRCPYMTERPRLLRCHPCRKLCLRPRLRGG